MGWAVGEDDERRRHIGYGVPATCDQPGCGASIDRGIAYACGGGMTSDAENCGLFFCSEHLSSFIPNADDRGGNWFCERCADDKPPFDPTPDVPEWIEHVLTDESWRVWRIDNPHRVAEMRTALPIDEEMR